MPFHLFPGEKGFAQANPAAQDSAVVGRHVGSSCVGGVAHKYFLNRSPIPRASLVKTYVRGLGIREAAHQEFLLHPLT